MAYFQTKNSNLGKYWRSLQWKILVYFMAIWYMYFSAKWYILWVFGIFFRFGIVFHILVCCTKKIWQPWGLSPFPVFSCRGNILDINQGDRIGWIFAILGNSFLLGTFLDVIWESKILGYYFTIFIVIRTNYGLGNITLCIECNISIPSYRSSKEVINVDTYILYIRRKDHIRHRVTRLGDFEPFGRLFNF
jgi:hypothetical protein